MKKTISFFIMVLIILCIVGCSDKNVYGNTENEILQYLKESDLLDVIGKDNISIVDSIYTKNSKIVGFSCDTGQGVIVYDKNKKGDYVMTDAQADGVDEKSLGITTYGIHYNSMRLENANRAEIIMSNGKIVSDINVIINDKYKYSRSMDIGKPSMAMIKNDLPDEKSREVIIDYRYFDINNNELQEEN
ncbi:MAG: hypothetical protein RR942_11060 [Romboutsia sp.]